MKHDEGFVQLAQSLRKSNIEALLGNEKDCKKVNEDKDFGWEIINDFIHKKHSGKHRESSQIFVPKERCNRSPPARVDVVLKFALLGETLQNLPTRDSRITFHFSKIKLSEKF